MGSAEHISFDTSDLHETIHQAVLRLKDGQTTQGYWGDCFDTGVMPNAQTAISLYLLGVSDPEWTLPLLRKIEDEQRQDGTWGVYPGDTGDLSTTVECYYALELYDRWRQRPQKKKKAKEFIKRRGGLKKCRNLTKMFLAVGGEIPWNWLPSPTVYSWMFARYTPVRIWDLVMFTRLHIAPMLILSSMQYVSDVVKAPLLDDLSLNVNGGHVLNRIERNPSEMYVQFNRKRMSRCIRFMLGEREHDGTAAGYHSSTFLILFAMKAFGDSDISRSQGATLHAMKRNLYVSSDGGFIHQQTCNGHVWNTSLAINALHDIGESADSPLLQKSLQYLLSKQQEAVGSWIMKSAVQPGGWGFSSNNTKHPDTDDTVSCLSALYPIRSRCKDVWWKGTEWLLSMQNRDGGWSAFEKNSNKWWLEWLPANDMRHSMADPSTPDITARVIEFLIRYRVLPRKDKTIQHGIRWLIRQQRRDGSWFGRWGSTYLYGTWCVVKALCTAELQSHHPSIERAKEWILSIQRPDGSFGEACESDLVGHYVSLDKGLPTQTSWGLDTLLYLLEIEESLSEQVKLQTAANLAASWLVIHANEGTWCEKIPTGSAFPGALHIRYHIYPKVWPLIALSHYRTTVQ